MLVNVNKKVIINKYLSIKIRAILLKLGVATKVVAIGESWPPLIGEIADLFVIMFRTLRENLRGVYSKRKKKSFYFQLNIFLYFNDSILYFIVLISDLPLIPSRNSLLTLIKLPKINRQDVNN